MVVATAETAAMTVVGKEGMALTAAKIAAMATIDCTGGRDGSNSRKNHHPGSSACKTETTGAMAGKQWRLFAVVRGGNSCDGSNSGGL
jgi:hypothetical protein